MPAPRLCHAGVPRGAGTARESTRKRQRRVVPAGTPSRGRSGRVPAQPALQRDQARLPPTRARGRARREAAERKQDFLSVKAYTKSRPKRRGGTAAAGSKPACGRACAAAYSGGVGGRSATNGCVRRQLGRSGEDAEKKGASACGSPRRGAPGREAATGAGRARAQAARLVGKPRPAKSQAGAGRCRGHGAARRAPHLARAAAPAAGVAARRPCTRGTGCGRSRCRCCTPPRRLTSACTRTTSPRCRCTPGTPPAQPRQRGALASTRAGGRRRTSVSTRDCAAALDSQET